MANTVFRTHAQGYGGRVIVLFLLFLLAIYQFIHAGFSAFAVICILPIFILFIFAAFQYRMFIFWALCFINFFIQFKNMPALPVPTSLPNEMLEISLLVLAIIDVGSHQFERTANIMLYAILLWCGFCTIEVLNDTCNLGINIGAWYTGARLLAFQLLYAFLVYILYINSPKLLMQYFVVWGGLSLFAVFWVWKQQTFGFTDVENAWIQTRGRSTHILQGGSLIRYFSTFSDAANFGIMMASTAVAFIIFAITAKIKKHRYFFLTVGIACTWGMFPSGTRTAIACLMAGFMAYIFLSKSFKIAIPFTIIFTLFAFMLVFTNIGNGNSQIRRMRTAFDKNDASAGARHANQEVMRKYMKDAPWGIGIGMGHENVPANNKYKKLSMIPPDSEYVFIWQHTGVVGITIFLITTIIMLGGACWIVFFTLKSPSLRGIGAGFCCAFVSQQLGGYGNQVLMQFPSCLLIYGGLSLVYALPYMEKDWIEYEDKQLAIQTEKERLKLEKKRASKV
ncbi:MAG: hypothetical protein K2I86_04755 [Prevotella sp.]|nr:hypothetical protein [Prevotella sp.]